MAAFVAPKLLAGYLALNHSNDAAFDLGRLNLCIGIDGEHIIAATSSMQMQRLGRRSMMANSGSTNRDVEHGHGGLIDNEILRNCEESLGIIGRDDRIRTCDPHTPSVMRYQAALRPDRQRPRRGQWKRAYMALVS